MSTSPKHYTLLGPKGFYISETPGEFGGYKAIKRMGPHAKNIYGRLDCPSATRYLGKGTYEARRVFFADEDTAIAAGFRPCGVCLRKRYADWKASGELGSVQYPWKVGP